MTIFIASYLGFIASYPISELPNKQRNNLLSFMMQVTTKQRPFLAVFGKDYEVLDGKVGRNYIHVMDLAEDHGKASVFIRKTSGAVHVLYVGASKTNRVMDLVRAFEKVAGGSDPIQICPRHDGDLLVYYESDVKAGDVLRLQSNCTLVDMCQSSLTSLI